MRIDLKIPKSDFFAFGTWPNSIYALNNAMHSLRKEGETCEHMDEPNYGNDVTPITSAQIIEVWQQHVEERLCVMAACIERISVKLEDMSTDDIKSIKSDLNDLRCQFETTTETLKEDIEDVRAIAEFK